MDRPLLSICIPTYNRADYFLKECLNSIVNQFDNDEICRQVEIVISDNASTDNTETVVREYQEKFDNIKYFKITEPVTPALNWDNAIKNSHGQYLNTIGDDDIYLPDSLNKILTLLAQEPSRVIAVAHVLIVEGQTRLADNYSGQLTKILFAEVAGKFFDFSDEMETDKMILGPGLLFFFGEVAREIVKTTGYFWKEPVGDHWAVFSMMSGQTTMAFYDWPVVGCRVHENNHMTMKYKHLRVQELLDKFLAKHDRNYQLFPGSSFTNLGYLGMQDIQWHFPEYRQFPINTDQGLLLHINDIFHSDFPIKLKSTYLFQSFGLLKEKKIFYGVKLLIRGAKFLVDRMKQSFKSKVSPDKP